MLSQVPGMGSLRFFSNSRPRWPANLMSSSAWRMPWRSRTPRPSSTGFDFTPVSAMSLMWMSTEPAGGALADRVDRVDPTSGGMADVDAKAEPRVERLDPLPGVERRGPGLVLGTVVVDRDLDVVFLDELVEDRERALLGATDDGRDTGVLGVLELLADRLLVLARRDVAAAQGGDPGFLELPGDGLAAPPWCSWSARGARP